MTDLLTSNELCELVGCTYRQLDHWCSLGKITPIWFHTASPHGSGNRRLFDVDACITAGYLLAASRLLLGGAA